MEHSTLILTLPVWIESFIERHTFPLVTVEARMQFVVALALENIKRKSGGPFAAAVFNSETGELIAPGVNRVVPLNCSLAHAEIMAIGMAQQQLGTHDLGGPGQPSIELVTSTEPCAMCLGAIPWSGIRKVVCGATDADARSAGFDEGAKPQNWVAVLEQKGIAVVTGVCAQEAALVFTTYKDAGGVIYNGRSTG
jgi:tRNA(Arg) A34 adenosine deaminase TadA